MADGTLTAASEIRPSVVRWDRLANIMSVSAAGAVASGVLSFAATKIMASVAGPAAIGLLGTLQQIRQTALTAATANGQTALVQGTTSLAGSERSDYLHTVSTIFLCATAAVAALLCEAPAAVARWSGLAALSIPAARWLAAAVVLSSLYVFLAAMLNALGAAHRLAALQMAGPAAMAALAFPAAKAASPAGLSALLAASAAVTVLLAIAALWRHGGTLADWFTGRRFRWRSGGFFSISTVMLATSLVSSAAMLSVRARILRAQGLAATGQFDAAWNISMNQVSLTLASLQTHYLPALARVQQTRGRGALIARVFTLAVPASAVAIVAIAATKEFWLGALYSHEFLGAARYLRWTLVGDYLKVGSWILSIPMLAAADMRVFFAADMAASAAFLASAVGLAHLRTTAEAAAMAFVLMHVVHLSIGAVYVTLRHGVDWRGLPAVAWCAGAVLVGGASFWNWNA